MPAAFIPPAPERYAARRACRASMSFRCPRKTRSGRNAARLADDHPEKRRMSLMQRLASVGLGRRADTEAPPAAPMPRPARPVPQYERPPQRPQRSQSRRPPARAGLGICAPRAAPQGLDPHGRALLCIIPARTTSSISRLSFAARRTDAKTNSSGPALAFQSGAVWLVQAGHANSIEHTSCFRRYHATHGLPKE